MSLAWNAPSACLLCGEHLLYLFIIRLSHHGWCSKWQPSLGSSWSPWYVFSILMWKTRWIFKELGRSNIYDTFVSSYLRTKPLCKLQNALNWWGKSFTKTKSPTVYFLDRLFPSAHFFMHLRVFPKHYQARSTCSSQDFAILSAPGLFPSWGSITNVCGVKGCCLFASSNGLRPVDSFCCKL